MQDCFGPNLWPCAVTQTWLTDAVARAYTTVPENAHQFAQGRQLSTTAYRNMSLTDSAQEPDPGDGNFGASTCNYE